MHSGGGKVIALIQTVADSTSNLQAATRLLSRPSGFGEWSQFVTG